MAGDQQTTEQKARAITVSAKQRACLDWMAEQSDGAWCDGIAWNFHAIAHGADLPADVTRRSVRALARKGLAEYQRGLFTEDGALAGSGYSITATGRAFAAAEPGTFFAMPPKPRPRLPAAHYLKWLRYDVLHMAAVIEDLAELPSIGHVRQQAPKLAERLRAMASKPEYVEASQR